MMAQNTSEDKEIADLDSHETKKSSDSFESIPVGASNQFLESFVHEQFKKQFKKLGLEKLPSNEYPELLRLYGMIYDLTLGRARPLNDTRSEAEREEDVKRIEDLLVWNMFHADFDKCRSGQTACGRIECWAAGEGLVNIVVALLRRGRAENNEQGTSNSGDEQETPMSKGLLALAIAAENNDISMVEALKDIAVSEESFSSREPDFPSPHKDLFYSYSNERLYTLYPQHEVWLCPIEAAARMGHVDMVTKLISLREAKTWFSPEKMKQVSEILKNNEIAEATLKKEATREMTEEKAKWRRAFDWAVRMGRHEVVKLLIDREYIVDLNQRSDVYGLLDNADVKSYGRGQTPLELAVLSGQFEVVKGLCGATKGGLNAAAYNLSGIMVLQMAYDKARKRHAGNSSEPFNPNPAGGILKILMERPEIDREVKRLTEERKVHVDAINAILVGTALIATATFAGWLSPPLGYSSPPGMDGPFASVDGHPILEKFWVFNSLSFFFSIATFMVGVNVAFPPREDIYIGVVVRSLRWKLRLAYYLVSAAVIFVIGAFASAGFAVLPPIPKYTVNMALTVGIGVTVVVVVVFTTSFGHIFPKPDWLQLMKKFCGWQDD